MERFLFDAVVPIVSEIWAGSMVITYRIDTKEAGNLITKIKPSVASWFFRYWTKICKHKHGMIKKLMESFGINAEKLAGYSEFDVDTLSVNTKFGDIDEQLDGIEVELGINQCWEADFEEVDGNRVDVIGHREVLVQTFCDRVDNVDGADCSGPSRKTDFSCSKGNLPIIRIIQSDSIQCAPRP